MARIIDRNEDDWGIEVFGPQGGSWKFKDCWPNIRESGALEVQRWVGESSPGTALHQTLSEWLIVFAPGQWSRVARITKKEA